MKSLSLRSRIIIALVALALGTTLVLSLLARHFLDQSLQVSVTPQIGQALNDALVLAKENYGRRKAAMAEAGKALEGSSVLNEAFQTGDPDRLRDVLKQRGLGEVSIGFVAPEESLPASFAGRLADGPRVFKSDQQEALLQLAVPVWENGRMVAALRVTESLDRFLRVERAVQTYGHLQMIFDHPEEDLYRAFLLAFLVAAAGVVFLASLVGVRIGFEITGPLYALIKGTRELARDNLDYRIPRGRADEIGLVINSFNRMTEDLKQNRRLRVEAEKIAAWQEIARRLAHEIKNPLTPIQLTVQQMRDKYAGNDPAYRKLIEDCTEIVTEEVESLRALVQEFADFARMPSLSLKRDDLNNVAMDAVRLYPEARISLDLDDLPELDLDIEQMRRVLINLIENSVEAAGENGALAIRTQSLNGTVKLLVSDSGPGVAEKDRERIFQPYISTKDSGMGLGLAVVRSIVENHGGQIVVTDGPDGGARFEITLPIPEALMKQPEVQP